MDNEMRNPKSIVHSDQPRRDGTGERRIGIAGFAAIAGGIGAGLAAAAFYNRMSAGEAEREHPPTGAFVEVDGVRLHYIARGEGRPLVLLHGNGVTAVDWEASGVIARAVAAGYRVIAFDRPGFGYSARPDGLSAMPREQARLIAHALDALSIRKPIIVGHSWGTMVALGLALDHPQSVAGLVLLSGYYFATARPDLLPQYPTAAPYFGALMSETITPLLARIFGPLQVKASFSPKPVSAEFADFPVSLALRPTQLRAASIEGAIMPSAAASLSKRYGELAMPLSILAGDGDKIAFPERHAARLHDAVARSDLRIIPGVGHMIHYSALDEVIAAIDRTAQLANA